MENQPIDVIDKIKKMYSELNKKYVELEVSHENNKTKIGFWTNDGSGWAPNYQCHGWIIINSQTNKSSGTTFYINSLNDIDTHSEAISNFIYG